MSTHSCRRPELGKRRSLEAKSGRSFLQRKQESSQSKENQPSQASTPSLPNKNHRLNTDALREGKAGPWQSHFHQAMGSQQTTLMPTFPSPNSFSPNLSQSRRNHQEGGPRNPGSTNTKHNFKLIASNSRSPP
ncbi:hypothetical protein P3X46_026813 [Hevea brasiliensis]|uniref:DUF4005 domain-containing protein n=1 Tax=Hevea brasiliensis TaxID=3981 RepID=A0ABQ9KZ89_HEVBR|nr:hypothetical protein P3X46_026813 [Hevea brasiliensis]